MKRSIIIRQNEVNGYIVPHRADLRAAREAYYLGRVATVTTESQPQDKPLSQAKDAASAKPVRENLGTIDLRITGDQEIPMGEDFPTIGCLSLCSARNISGQDLADLLSEMINLKTLKLINTDFPTDEKIVFPDSLENLEILTPFPSSEVDAVALSVAMKNCRNLRRVTIHYSNDIPLCLPECVRELTLTCCSTVGDVTLGRTLSGCINLEKLCFKGRWVPSLIGVKFPGTFKKLHISGLSFLTVENLVSNLSLVSEVDELVLEGVQYPEVVKGLVKRRQKQKLYAVHKALWLSHRNRAKAASTGTNDLFNLMVSLRGVEGPLYEVLAKEWH